MAKVQIINKSRKEFKCNKCSKLIPVGSKYYRGEINFGPTLIRCESCGLKDWEVTTSEYQLAIGEIIYEWRSHYSLDEDGIDSLIGDIEEIKDELESKLDNMPYQLQDSDTGMLLQERIDELESSLYSLESIDISSLRDDALTDYRDNLDFEGTDSELDNDELLDWESAEDELSRVNRQSDWQELTQYVLTELEAEIEEALSEINV